MFPRELISTVFVRLMALGFIWNITERSSYAMCFCAEERNPKARKFYCNDSERKTEN